MRNNNNTVITTDPLQSIRCALLPPSLSSSSLMNSAESTLAALGNIINARSTTGGIIVTNNINNNNNQDDKMLPHHWPVKNNNNNAPAGKPPRGSSSSSGQNKMLLAQIARLQTEFQMQAVRHQSTIAELRRRLAYISARQTHTPLAVERTHLIRLPLTSTNSASPKFNNNNNDGITEPAGAAMAQKFGFSLLPDGTGLGGAIVTSVVNESIAFTAGLHIFDRICQVDGVDVCNSSSITFTQLVELLKGNNISSNINNKQFLTLEIARFEEPGCNNKASLFNCDDNNSNNSSNQVSPISSSPANSSSKENDEQYSPSPPSTTISCQCNLQQPANNKVTVASVAVQTLPCLNPWFLADVRTSSTAVRTLRSGQQEKLQQKPTTQQLENNSVTDLISSQNNVKNHSRVVTEVTPPVTVKPPSLSGQASCPTIGISNFVPPANLNIPSMLISSSSKTAIMMMNKTEDEVLPARSASDDSAIGMIAAPISNNNGTIEEPVTMTLSSEKTWRTSSSSTTISLSNSQSADHKSVSSSRSISSGKKDSLSSPSEQSSSSNQQTPEKSSLPVAIPGNSSSQSPAGAVENFQRPITMYTNSQHLAHTIRIQQHLFLQVQAQTSKAKLLDNDAVNETCFDEEEELLDDDQNNSSSKTGDESQQNQQQQELEEQSKRRLSSLSYISCTSSPMTPSNRHLRQSAEVTDDFLSWNDGSSNGKGRDASSADACRDYRWVVKVKSDGTRRIVKRPVRSNGNQHQMTETPSSCNNDYEDEKTSHNSTPAESHHRRHRQHHSKPPKHGEHHRHHRRHENHVDDVNDSSVQSASTREKSSAHQHHHHHTPKTTSKHHSEAVLAVTTV